LKGLAEYVMRGRLQALVVAVAGAGSLLFCWVSAAAVALVTLRKGAGQGAWVFMWALLPAIVMLVGFGDSGPLALLCGTMVLALVLRATVSLQLAVLAAVGVGVVAGVAILVVSGEYLDQLAGYFNEVLTALEQQLAKGQQAVALPRPDAVQIAGMLGAGTATMSVLCLMLARYWQAALYNPGGFGEEFRALFYPAAVSTVLLVAAIVLFSLGMRFRTWAMICLVPLTFAGLALVHSRARTRGRGTGWLTGFYITWLIFDLVKLVVVCFAIADSWMNFRRRWNQESGKAGNSSKDLRERDERNDEDDRDI
jgi:hypothetical protein